MFEESAGALSTYLNYKATSSTTHVEVKHHRVRSLLADEVAEVMYMKTDLLKADILTKSLGAVKFLRNHLLTTGLPVSADL